MSIRATSRACLTAAALFGALYATSGAKAFTIEDQGGARSGQAFMDLDKPAAPPDRHTPVSPFNSSNGQTTYKQGDMTLQFGQQRPFSDRFSTETMFNPYTREGR